MAMFERAETETLAVVDGEDTGRSSAPDRSLRHPPLRRGAGQGQPRGNGRIVIPLPLVEGA